MDNQINGIRLHNNYEEMYGCIQYFEGGVWKDIGKRWELTNRDVIFLQSELPELDAEIMELEERLEYLTSERNEIARELGLKEI